MARFGVACLGSVRQGTAGGAGQGGARLGADWHGTAGLAWQDVARRGEDWRGAARQRTAGAEISYLRCRQLDTKGEIWLSVLDH